GSRRPAAPRPRPAPTPGGSFQLAAQLGDLATDAAHAAREEEEVDENSDPDEPVSDAHERPRRHLLPGPPLHLLELLRQGGGGPGQHRQRGEPRKKKGQGASSSHALASRRSSVSSRRAASSARLASSRTRNARSRAHTSVMRAKEHQKAGRMRASSVGTT